MNDNRDVERMLEDLPKPKVREGTHRQELKDSLLNQFHKEKKPMRSWRKTLAWAACFLLVATLGGVTAQQVVKVFSTKFKGEYKEGVVKTPDGKTIFSIGHSVPERIFSTKTNDPSMTDEKAQKIHKEIKELIDQQKYTLVASGVDSSGHWYKYKLILSDGSEFFMGSSHEWGKEINVPMSDPAEMGRLYAEGRYELIETNITAKGDTLYLYRFTRHDGTTFDFDMSFLMPVTKK
jgi:hypothetical protein